MIWRLSHRGDPVAAALADRHYSRQSPGAAQFVPPGRCIVLLTRFRPTAVWVTSWQGFVDHDWPNAWVCSLFRNEDCRRSSWLIESAVAATRGIWGTAPERGFITFVDPSKVRRKRDPGRCFLRAGWRRVGETKGGLVVLQQLERDMPVPDLPVGAPYGDILGRVPA